MNVICKKFIKMDEKTISKEEMIDETFEEIVDIKIRKLIRQVNEIKITKSSNLGVYDKALDELKRILQNYKKKDEIKKKWKFGDNEISVFINYEKSIFEINKKLNTLGYESHRRYSK